MKKLLLVVTLVVAFTLTGCDNTESLFTGDEEVIKAEGGIAYSEVGDINSTVFFDYKVEKVTYPTSVGDIEAKSGNQLVEVTLVIESVLGNDNPMSTGDFALGWCDYDGTIVDAIGPTAVDKDGYMPEIWELEAFEAVRYKIVFEVPSQYSMFALGFIEFYDNDEEGDTFLTSFDK